MSGYQPVGEAISGNAYGHLYGCWEQLEPLPLESTAPARQSSVAVGDLARTGLGEDAPLPLQLSPRCLLQAGGRTEIQRPLEGLGGITPFPASVSLRRQRSVSAPHSLNKLDGFSTYLVCLWSNFSL